MTALDLVKKFEGCKLTAYQDGGGVWTIGWGHTGPHVHEGMTVTQGQADAWLEADLNVALYALQTLVTVTLTPGQRAALGSFVFNLGAGRLKTSTLLRKLNAGDYAGAAAEFPRWNKDNGKVVAGLTRRRLAEQAAFKA